MLSTGPGFNSTPPIISSDANNVAHDIIDPIKIFPFLVSTPPTDDRHENLAAQVPTRAGYYSR